MRLAEALILRADCKKRFDQLKQRIAQNAKVQEGDEPAEDPEKLIKEMEAVSDHLLDLIQRINATNSATKLEKGKSLSDAIAERDVIMLKRTVYSGLAEAASVSQSRTSKSEVKFKSTVSVSDIQKKVDALSKSYRELDSKIQEFNWSTDLLETDLRE
jgi:hypothetical protein